MTDLLLMHLASYEYVLTKKIKYQLYVLIILFIRQLFWYCYLILEFSSTLGKGCRGGEGWAASWGGGAVEGGSVNAFLAAALTRVMRAAVPIPAVASASVVHSAALGGSVVGVVRPL